MRATCPGARSGRRRMVTGPVARVMIRVGSVLMFLARIRPLTRLTARNRRLRAWGRSLDLGGEVDIAKGEIHDLLGPHPIDHGLEPGAVRVDHPHLRALR